MIRLQVADRLNIVRWLSELREFETEIVRRRLLELAGLEALAPQIDVSGAPLMAAASVVDFLVRYGRPTEDAEALGLLLNLCSSLVSPQRQEEISDVMRRYAMMTPVAPSPAVHTTTEPIKVDAINEKIIGQNTLRAVAFLARGLRAARSLGLVKVDLGDQAWTGSGFLVAPDLLLTNFHVVGSDAEAQAATVVFDFEEDELGRMRQTTIVEATELVASDKALDFSLIRLGSPAGDDYGWLPLRPRGVEVGARVNIIQHPGGQPKQVALQHNLVEYVGGDVIQYVTSTLPGSSGSPVFDDTWNVVALHHAGGMISEPTTGNSYFRNEGVSVAAIISRLSVAIQELIGLQAGGGTP